MAVRDKTAAGSGRREKLIYRVAHKSVNMSCSLVIKEALRFKPGRQFVKRYHIVSSRALNTEELISNTCWKSSGK
jgi:hypothetical protein